MSEVVQPPETARVPDPAPPAPRPLRLLGADAVVCEGDSCLVQPAGAAQS